MIADYFKFSIASLKHRKLRAWLTVIGIVIGIAAIISLISLGQGLENAIEDQFAKMGTNSIRVVPKGLSGPPTGFDILNQNDADALGKIAGVDYVTAIILERAKINYGNEEQYGYVVSFPSDDVAKRFSDTDIQLLEGRVFGPGEKSVAMIGYDTAKEMFEKEIRLRNAVQINDQKFKIIGIFEYQGNPQIDESVYIPLETGRELFDKPTEVSVIMLTIQEGRDLNVVSTNVKRKLDRLKDEETYEVFTPEELLGQLTDILGIVQFILAGIAAISLAVGGIGIMNSMYTSVLQRTRDIGIMKAIGATRNDIRMTFLVESGIMGFGGGVFGVILGLGMAFAVEQVAMQLGFPFLNVQIDFQLVLFALAFAFIVGVVSGVLPALKAAKMQPVEALRYE